MSKARTVKTSNLSLGKQASGVEKSAPFASAEARVNGNPQGNSIDFDEVRHMYRGANGAPTWAIADLSIHIPENQFVAFVGPSGCGKTTALNMVAGLVEASEGTVRIGGDVTRGPHPGVAYMFARDCLLPWRSAQKNAEFGLELRGVNSRDRSERARRWLQIVGLGGRHTAFPSQLSQGMRQRVAIARTLAMSPSILLLDEPFAALDAQTRLQVQQEFLDLWQETPSTVILVTHDLEEAVALADRVIVFSKSPGYPVLDLPIELPRPRDLSRVRFEDAFVSASAVVNEALSAGMRVVDA